MKTKYYFLLFSLASFIFMGCSKDDDKNSLTGTESALKIDKEAIELKTEEKAIIHITDGNGDYNAFSLNEDVAVATLNNDQLEIVGKAIGNTYIIIADKNTQLKLLPVNVFKYDVLKLDSTSIDFEFIPGSSRFKEVKIVEGNGNYTAVSADENVATVVVKDSFVVITPRGLGGKTEIVVTDASNRSATISVNAVPQFKPYTKEQLEAIKSENRTPLFIFEGKRRESYWPIINGKEDGMNLSGFAFYTYNILKIWYPGDKSVGEYKGGKILYKNLPYTGQSSDGAIDLTYFEIIKNDGEKIWAVFSVLDNNILRGGYFILNI